MYISFFCCQVVPSFTITVPVYVDAGGSSAAGVSEGGATEESMAEGSKVDKACVTSPSSQVSLKCIS